MLKECKINEVGGGGDDDELIEIIDYFRKTFEIQGFKQLVDQIADSKKTTADQIISQINAAGGPSVAGTTVNSLSLISCCYSSIDFS